jgi:hypothetical protein
VGVFLGRFSILRPQWISISGGSAGAKIQKL